MGADVEEEREDDGFLDALNGSASDDWTPEELKGEDDDDEEETADI